MAQGALGSWADWAIRNLDPEVQITPIQTYVERCCHPSLSQPNLALDLELADYINQKKANTPREAAIETVRKINSRNPHIGMLALHLLDILVKNCGYPFHLQIATKEFLNELVKRFPERPPPFPSPVQSKILEMIHEWKLTICVTSKQKEDLVHIRDMHRLLSYKGYRFPNIDSRAAGVMNPENNLKSPEELEEEDRAAQGAKLQELIRRGTPRDLAQAQELMKIMSGAEPESKPDYASQVRKELDKIQSRAILLNDMLNNAKQGERFAKGDAYDQISSHLRSVQPRIQKWIGEAEAEEAEGEDGVGMERLLLINDLINQVCERYKAFTRGEWSAKATIDPSIDPSRNGADAVPTAKIQDLIDFGEEDAAAAASSAATPGGHGGSSILDDFASLSFGDTPPAPTAAKEKEKAAEVGPGGLPADLFSSMAPIQPTSTGASGWGALQLPTSSSASVSSSSAPLTPSLVPTSSSSKPTQPQQPQQAGKNDPFADLDAMFK
ncbi:ARF-binding protein [Thecaphora frezii]